MVPLSCAEAEVSVSMSHAKVAATAKRLKQIVEAKKSDFFDALDLQTGCFANQSPAVPLNVGMARCHKKRRKTGAMHSYALLFANRQQMPKSAA